eukprot:TRINITY_DN11749_c0_g1_i14.p1 TRINITY_DN11749_c0_g1~~TRINITY_DN11749_c0_g1_i14.p1  ORF type:complete len:141 (-),score=46.23 TRINITY_DN11749_c0_g1_i14:105-527(-)
MTMKSNLKDIEDNVHDALASVKNDYKLAIKLRADYGILEHGIAKSFSENLTEYMREIFRVEGRLKRLIQEDTAEMKDIRGQVVEQIKEKILVQENVNCNISRVAQIESHIGYEFNKLKRNQENEEHKEEIALDENEDYTE